MIVKMGTTVIKKRVVCWRKCHSCVDRLSSYLFFVSAECLEAYPRFIHRFLFSLHILCSILVQFQSGSDGRNYECLYSSNITMVLRFVRGYCPASLYCSANWELFLDVCFQVWSRCLLHGVISFIRRKAVVYIGQKSSGVLCLTILIIFL